MPTTDSATETEPNVPEEPAPLSRRELRALEKEAEEAARNAALVEGPPPVRPTTTKSDNWMPPLFKEEAEAKVVKEEPVVVAAEYAREAPAGKHVYDTTPARIVIPPAPKPVPGTQYPRVGRSAEPEPTSSNAVLKIVGLSVLYYALPVVAGIASFMMVPMPVSP